MLLSLLAHEFTLLLLGGVKLGGAEGAGADPPDKSFPLGDQQLRAQITCRYHDLSVR